MKAINQRYVQSSDEEWDSLATDPQERLIQEVVIPAAEDDADIRRMVARQWTQLDPPGDLARNTALHKRAQGLVGRGPGNVDALPAGPTRDDALQIIAHYGRQRGVHQ